MLKEEYVALRAFECAYFISSAPMFEVIGKACLNTTTIAPQITRSQSNHGSLLEFFPDCSWLFVWAGFCFLRVSSDWNRAKQQDGGKASHVDGRHALFPFRGVGSDQLG